jgi:hypothetical protein
MILNALHVNKDLASMFGAGIRQSLNEPHITVNHLGGIQYADILQRTLPFLLEDKAFNVHKGTWVEHNGTPPQFLRQACTWLLKHFPEVATEVIDHNNLINHILVAATDIKAQPKQLVCAWHFIQCHCETHV